MMLFCCGKTQNDFFAVFPPCTDTENGITGIRIVGDDSIVVGKTVFTRGFVSHFGHANVKSPTYTIVNEYRPAGTRVYHFDLYRIEDGDDLESIGYHDYVESNAYCIVEWSERVPEYIPEDAITVTISRVSDDEAARDIEIEGVCL